MGTVKSKLETIETSINKICHKEISESINEKNEIDKRKMNLMIFGLEENHDPGWDNEQKIEQDLKIVENIVKEELGVGLSPRRGIVDVRRMGIKKPNRNRPLRVTFSDIQVKRDVLTNGRKLRQSSTGALNKVYINPDLTPAQREIEKELRDEMWKRREAGEKVIISKGKLVETTRDIKMKRDKPKFVPNEKATGKTQQPTASNPM